MSVRVSTQPIPHSWGFGNWPGHVYPGDGTKARWIARAYRNELMAEGAIARLNKSLLFLGAGYARFLAKRVVHVPGYESNNPEIGQPKAA